MAFTIQPETKVTMKNRGKIDLLIRKTTGTIVSKVLGTLKEVVNVKEKRQKARSASKMMDRQGHLQQITQKTAYVPGKWSPMDPIVGLG